VTLPPVLLVGGRDVELLSFLSFSLQLLELRDDEWWVGMVVVLVGGMFVGGYGLVEGCVERWVKKSGRVLIQNFLSFSW
jgi:hypothetical protein